MASPRRNNVRPRLHNRAYMHAVLLPYYYRTVVRRFVFAKNSTRRALLSTVEDLKLALLHWDFFVRSYRTLIFCVRSLRRRRRFPSKSRISLVTTLRCYPRTYAYRRYSLRYTVDTKYNISAAGRYFFFFLSRALFIVIRIVVHSLL